MRPAIFFDRDDTLIECSSRGLYYVVSHNQVKITPEAVEALDGAGLAGWQLVCVTNQSCIGRGLLDLDAFEAVMLEVVSQWCDVLGVSDTIYYAVEKRPRGDLYMKFEPLALPYDIHVFVCTHTGEQGCTWRKPRTGMLAAAEEMLGIDLASPRTVVIGDSVADRSMAASAQLRYYDVNVDGWRHITKELGV